MIRLQKRSRLASIHLIFRFLLLALVAVVSLKAEEPVVPQGAIPLLVGVPLQPTSSKPDEGRITNTAAGFLLESPRKLEKSYNLAVSCRFSKPLVSGQVCLVVLKTRTTQSSNTDGKGRITVAVQNTKNYSTTPLWKH